MENSKPTPSFSNEFKVGFFTISAFLVLMASILFVSNFSFAPGGYVVTATFQFLGNLKVDSPVR
ncbi:MAG TPA: hypothetical protein VMU88_06500, partial [bacterium]|nr:hypothetical protein [bacterium]